MGLFDFFKKRNDRNIVKEQLWEDIIPKTKHIKTEIPKLSTENEPTREYTYVKVADRKNRYELVGTEGIVNDAGAAEAYEKGLIGRLECYDNIICPNCGVQLEKLPKLKEKCTHCKESMHVVKSYIELDRAMLLTLQEKDTLKKHRDTFFKLKQLSKDISYLGITKTDYNRARSELDSSFSYQDVIWHLLNNKSLEEFTNMRLGLHSNVHRIMGKVLEDEGNYRAALQQYLYLIYLDINGCTNYGKGHSLTDCFEVSTGFIAPGILDAVVKCMKKCDMTLDDVHKEFMELKKRQLPTPLTVLQSWNKFKQEYNRLCSEK